MFSDKKIIYILVSIAVFVLFIIIYSLSSIFNAKEGLVIIITKPGDSIIVIKDKEYKDNTEIKLPIGVYSFSVKKEGYYETTKVELRVENDKTTTKEIKLQKKISENEMNFIKMLPKETVNYKINYASIDDGNVKYIIHLYAVNNGYEWQQQIYLEQLSSYKKEAFKFIESQSLAPEKLNIEFIPETAANL